MDKKQKRNKIEKRILEIMSKLDSTGKNKEMYKQLFDSMNDKQFDTFMKNIRDGVTNLFIIMPNMESSLKMNDVIHIAKEYNIELFQRIFLTDNNTGRKYLTNQKYMIIDLPIRRVKQYLFNKISLPESDQHINVLTGQVIPPDKGSSLDNEEIQILASKGLDKSLLELIKVRGGDLKAYHDFKYTLEEEGKVSLSEISLENRPRSVVTAGIYLNSMMFEHNLSG